MTTRSRWSQRKLPSGSPPDTRSEVSVSNKPPLAGESAPTENNLQPKGLRDDDGAFILKNSNMLALIRYIWSGCLLPSDRKEFCARLQVPLEDLSKDDWKYIDPLLSCYETIYTHTGDFRKDVYNKQLADVANAIYNYSLIAGGDGTKDSSAYDAIMSDANDCLAELEQEHPDEEAVIGLTESVVAGTNAMKESIDDLIKLCNGLISTLGTFQGYCASDKATLGPILDTLKTSAVSASKDEITKLEAEISKNQGEIAEDEKVRDHDLRIIDNIKYYCWIFPYGTITAITEATIHAQHATKMSARMKLLRDTIKDDSAKVAADRKLIAEISHMEQTGQALYDLVQPAMDTVTLLMTCWNSIKADLQLVQDTIKEAKKAPKRGKWADHVKVAVVNSWRHFTLDVSDYRKNAFVSEAQVKTIEEAIHELDLVAAK